MVGFIGRNSLIAAILFCFIDGLALPLTGQNSFTRVYLFEGIRKCFNETDLTFRRLVAGDF